MRRHYPTIRACFNPQPGAVRRVSCEHARLPRTDHAAAALGLVKTRVAIPESARWAACMPEAAVSGSELAANAHRTRPHPRTSVCRLACSARAMEQSARPSAAAPNRRVATHRLCLARRNGHRPTAPLDWAWAARLRKSRLAAGKAPVNSRQAVAARALARANGCCTRCRRARPHTTNERAK
jgi:hypothetical protein